MPPHLVEQGVLNSVALSHGAGQVVKVPQIFKVN
jgi:hypothetical protein